MAKYSNTKAKINEKIATNGRQAVTGAILNDVLQTMVDSLGADYQFGGLVQPGSSFTAGEQPVVFLATTPGTYTHFGGLVVADGEVALLVWSGSAWSKQTPDIATRTEVSQLGQEVIDITGRDETVPVTSTWQIISIPKILAGSIVRNTGDYLFYLLDENAGSIASFMPDAEATINVDAHYLKASSTANVNYKYRVLGKLDEYQKILAFDDYPSSQSDNPVTSAGIELYGKKETSRVGIEDEVITFAKTADAYIDYTGLRISINSYSLSQPICVKKGDVLSVRGEASESIAVLSYYFPNDNSYEPVLIGQDASSNISYTYQAEKDGIIYISLKNSGEFSIRLTRLANRDIFTDSLGVHNLYNPATATDNYRVLSSNGTLYADNNFLASDYIFCKGVSKITIPYDINYFGTAKLAYYGEDLSFIGAITGTMYGILAEFVIPTAAYYIRVNNLKYKNEESDFYKNACTFMCIDSGHEYYPTFFIKYGENSKIVFDNIHSPISINPLYGKKVVFTGDSICNGDSDEAHMDVPIFSTLGHGWPVRIGTKNNMLWVNKGISGGTLTDKDVVGSSFTISDTNFGTDPDYIIMEGGVNDADRIGSIIGGTIPAEFGTYNNHDYNVTFDNDTFCGAVESLFKRVLEDYPHAKKGFIIAQKMSPSSQGYSASANNRRAYFEVIIELCKKWGIPYIDLWETAPMCPMLPEHYTWQQTKLYSGGTSEKQDGQHPTADGFDILSPMIEAWMKTL